MLITYLLTNYIQFAFVVLDVSIVLFLESFLVIEDFFHLGLDLVIVLLLADFMFLCQHVQIFLCKVQLYLIDSYYFTPEYTCVTRFVFFSGVFNNDFFLLYRLRNFDSG